MRRTKSPTRPQVAQPLIDASVEARLRPAAAGSRSTNAIMAAWSAQA
jgi:hypothetical protein